MLNTQTFVLQNATMITPKVRHLSFLCKENSEFPFIPGQFITFHIDAENHSVKRSYSIASIPTLDKTIDIAASYVEGGIGSELLFNLKPGDEMKATGPFGRLTLRDEKPQRYILMATGTGVTPYRSMLPEIAQRIVSHNLQAVVLLGVQSRDELLYGEDFVRFAEQHPENFTFEAYYSRVQPSDSKSFEKTGYVHLGLEKLQATPGKDIIYLCGNPNMIDQAFSTLKESGFEQQHIRREKYISAK